VDYGFGSVVFVVTAMDRLRTDQERARILELVRQRISGAVLQHAAAKFGHGTEECEQYLRRLGQPRIFGVSGFDALSAKTQGDTALLDKSGFVGLEIFLERFLTEESGLVALKTHTKRILALTN